MPRSSATILDAWIVYEEVTNDSTATKHSPQNTARMNDSARLPRLSYVKSLKRKADLSEEEGTGAEKSALAPERLGRRQGL